MTLTLTWTPDPILITNLVKIADQKGVLEVNEIGQEEQQQQAIVFDPLIPFRQAIFREQLLNDNIILNGHPQSMQRMSLENYAKILELGGIYAG